MSLYHKRFVLVLDLFVLILLGSLAFYHRTAIYLIAQARGQLSIMMQTQSFEEFQVQNKLSARQLSNLKYIEAVKRFSVDSLGYDATDNYTKIYDQKRSSTLWVITASEPYRIKAYEWKFPFIGWVSYKGYFDRSKAVLESGSLKEQGYDVELSPVSAWSTLGWTSDPVLSSMLDRNTGSLCNLLFHELFHATYYAPGKVNLNENLASFIAHQATLLFLAKDTNQLRLYVEQVQDRETFSKYIEEQTVKLNNTYQEIRNKKNNQALKLQALQKIAGGIDELHFKDKVKFTHHKKAILLSKNAYFIDFLQYHSLQDSLAGVFNKIYKGNIKKMVRDLKQN